MVKLKPNNLSLDFVKQYLRVEHNLDDLEIQTMIDSAESYVRNYIKVEEDEPLDCELIIPILTIVAYCYENKTIAMKANEKEDILFNTILNMHRTNIL